MNRRPRVTSVTASDPVEGAYWAYPASALLAALDTREAGLREEEASRRLAQVGPNRMRRSGSPLWREVLHPFASPIVLLLVVATLISAVVGDVADASIILAIVLLSGLLGFVQEHRASRAVVALLASIDARAHVRRDGCVVERPATAVVPGDVVTVAAGDVVLADAVLLTARGLQVDEAPLTGESYPVDKAPGVAVAGDPLARRANCLFMGTHVVGGDGAAVVVRTGGATELGRVSSAIAAPPATTGFERGVARLGGMLAQVMAVLVVVVFVANVAFGRGLVEALLFSLALAVGLTPQLLPAIVSVSLATGARRMARRRVIVRRLDAIEDFGGMDVLCTDKTGTITEGVVRLEGALDPDGRPSPRVATLAYLNATRQTGVPNAIDAAIAARPPRPAPAGEALAEVPYDFARRRLSVLLRVEDRHLLVTKGAVAAVLDACDAVPPPGGGTAPPWAAARAHAEARFRALSGAGYRVLGIAVRDLGARTTAAPSDEDAMTFLGFLTFADAPKPGAAAAIRELAALGIAVRLLTGDNRFAAAYMAARVGLDDRELVVGADVDALSDEALAARAERTAVCAELAPAQKRRVIAALSRSGHSVGFLGDGINDVPALRAADVGISVADAADVARACGDIVLLEKDLGVLAEGVRLGRRTFANTLKYIFVTTSANFGNMVSMSIAAFALPFLPLLPRQILLLNFLSDFPAMAIAADTADPEQLGRPERWDIGMIWRFMLTFGLISTVFDLLTFGVLRAGYGTGEVLFRSGWFVESLATELWALVVLRTRRRFFRSRPAPWLLGLSVAVGVVAVVLPFSPFAGPLGLAAIPSHLLAGLAVLTALYVAATELAKRRFYSGAARPASPA